MLERDCDYITYFPVNIAPLSGTDLAAGQTNAAFGFGIYFHVPLCDQICPFCNYNKFTTGGNTHWLTQQLERECDLYAAAVDSAVTQVDFVYFGGGTPSVLEPQAVGSLLRRLGTRFDLSLAEVCLECHPAHATPSYLAGLREAGVDRVSFGIQSLNGEMLSRIGSHHTVDQASSCVAAARTAGFANVAIDLMFLLPGQQLDDWASDLDRAIELGADHISTYRMLLDPAAPLGRAVRLGRAAPQAGEAVELAMAEHALSFLADAGFRHYGSCSSAGFDLCQPGFESGYELHHRAAPQCEYAALGPGAVGFLNGHVYWNIHTLAEYARTVEAGDLPVLAGRRLTESDHRSRHAVLGVKHLSLDVACFVERFGVSLQDAFPQAIDHLTKHGLITLDSDALTVTPRGVHHLDNVSKAFFNAENYRLPQPYKPDLQLLSVELFGASA